MASGEELRIDYDPVTQQLTITVNRAVGEESTREWVRLTPIQQHNLNHIMRTVIGIE